MPWSGLVTNPQSSLQGPVVGRHSLNFLVLVVYWDNVEIRWPPPSETHGVHGDSTLKCIIKNYIITRERTSMLILETLQTHQGNRFRLALNIYP